MFKLSPAGEVLARLGMREGERQPFARVSGVAALPDGTVLASDAARCVLVRFASDGKVLGEIGYPHGRGRMNGLVAAGVDRSGGFYLVGARQGSLIRWCDADGVVRAEFGGEGAEPGKLLRPRAAAVGPEGNLYVADSELHRITVYRNDGALVRVFGKAGKGASDVRYPRAIACSADGLVYVGDAGNRRVQLFKSTGEFVRTFATGLSPFALDVDREGRVAVYDDADAVVATFDAGGRELARVSVRDAEGPAGMALAADGKVWMLDRRRGLVKAFAADGTSETVLRDPRLGWGATLARGADGRIFIASYAGILPIEAGGAGAFVEARLPFEPGKLLQPSSLALVWDDELAVMSGPTGVVQVFGRDGAFRRVLVTTPVIRGIARIAAAPGGDLLVLSALDGALYRVAKDGRATQVLAANALRGAGSFALTADGKLWADRDVRGGLVLFAPDGKELGGIPSGRDRRRSSWGRSVTATPAGDALVTEKSGGTVTCYAQDLSVRWTLDAEKLDDAARLRGGIAAAKVDAAGNLILLGADWSGFRILSPPSGTPSPVGTRGDRALVAAARTDGALGSLSDPSDFALDADGSLYVADTGNNRVVKFARRASRR